jgi:hypothetical protein
MNMAPDAEGRVTIVMTARERHSLAEAAIDSVVARTPRPFRFIYVDVQSPDWLRPVQLSYRQRQAKRVADGEPARHGDRAARLTAGSAVSGEWWTSCQPDRS